MESALLQIAVCFRLLQEVETCGCLHARWAHADLVQAERAWAMRNVHVV